MKSPYRFALHLYRQNGESLGEFPIAVDWEPAEEWTRFRALRRGALLASERCEAAVTPIWSRGEGPPFVRGFRVDLSRPGAATVDHEFPTLYFKEPALKVSSDLVDRGLLDKGEVFRYRPVAFREDAEPKAPRFAFTTEEVMPPLVIRDASAAALESGATASGEARADEFRVFVPRRVLDQAARRTREACEKETGGVLIGHLRRDAALADLFLEITAQIPARHARGDSTRLTFTPETWTQVRAALDLRRHGEVMVGWWHSHPSRAWCARCTPEKQRVCPLAADFFSEHDVQLHRTVFPRAYSVALVVNDALAGLGLSMFGWREGLVAPRGFHGVGGIPGVEPVPAGATVAALDTTIAREP